MPHLLFPTMNWKILCQQQDGDGLMSKVYCKVVRPSTGSELSVEIPENIVREVNAAQDTATAVDWIREEFNWQFIPREFYKKEDNE